MVFVKYLWIILLILTNAVVDIQAINGKKGANKTCNKQAFEEKLKSNTKLVDATSIHDECASMYPKCQNVRFSIRVASAINAKEQLYLLATLYTVEAGCWGYLVNIHYNGVRLHLSKYISQEEINSADFLIAQDKLINEVSYILNVTQIPSGKTKSLSIKKTPSTCEIAAFSFAGAVKAFSNCRNPPGFSEILSIMSKVCKYFSNDVIKVTRYLKQSELTQRHCRLVPFDFPVEEKLTKKSQIKTSIIFVAIGGLSIFLILVIFKIIRMLKQKSTSANKWLRKSQKGDCAFGKEGKYDEVLQNTATRVMILNRPGCKLLDTLLRDLALVLKAYGIDVKLSLLEQGQIDVGKEMSSYIEKNIDSCDYVLIFFAEHNKEHTSLKHRLYEFFLKFIARMAYHQNMGSTFIPLYLTSYDKAITLMPSFLVAAQDAGYRIPNNLMSLVTRLSGGKKPIESKELLAKLNHLLNRMKATCKKMESKEHKECSEGDCDKGTLNDSVSNLSSVCTCTAPSKRPSFHSIAIKTKNGVVIQHEVILEGNVELTAV
ncbi:uncharacterized protein LOC130638079 [Hydractinia symbiolongicarpus]|uniref:uncharacterized protein LOC130638079 n=1 Tax=Hydractinia symbiolongicarpus TaxID=13093 RepID=UPI00254E9012|nr:uncharacterized protein LOC130638079 [Hydractinia symbiolongicarpus]